MNYIKTNFLSLVSAIILFAAVPIVFAWTAPRTGIIPPNENAPAPINVSNIAQSKDGNLGLKGLGVFGQVLINNSGSNNYLLNDATKPFRSSLSLGVNGKVGAKEFCDENGETCVDIATLANITNINNTTTEQGDFIFINPENRSKTPLECLAGKNYQISNFKSVHATLSYTVRPLIDLEAGTWNIKGNFNFVRQVDPDSAQAFRLRTAISGGGPVVDLVASASKKGSGLVNMATKIVTVPDGKTASLEFIGTNTQVAGDIVAWCNNRGSTLSLNVTPTSPYRLNSLTLDWLADNLPTEAPVALKILDSSNKVVYTYAGDKTGIKSRVVPLTDLTKFTKNGTYKAVASMVAEGRTITATSSPFTLLDPTAQFSLSGTATLTPTNNAKGSTTKLTASFPMSVVVEGGTLTKPVIGDFVVKFRNSTTGVVTDDSTATLKQTFPTAMTNGTYQFVVESSYTVPAHTTAKPTRGSYTAEIVSTKYKFGAIPAETQAQTTFKTVAATAQ